MKAALLIGPGQIKIERRPEARIGDDEDVLVRAKRVGICGSDIALYNGACLGYPLIFGHEWSGIIEDAGKSVTEWNIGDKVTGECSLWCGKCAMCKMGNKDLCQRMKKFGITIDGACREFFTINQKYLHRAPNGMEYKSLSMTEPTAVVLQGLSLLGSIRNKVAIFGSGTLGLLALQICKNAGAEVIVLDSIRKRLELAKKLGADHIINVQKNDPRGEIKKITSNTGVDISIEVSGSSDAFKTAIDTTKALGTILLIGHVPETTFTVDKIVMKMLKIVGNIGGTGSFKNALDAIFTREIRVDPIITHTFKLDSIEEAFKVATNKDKCVKVSIEFD